MQCQVIRDNNNNIDKVYTPANIESKLYQELIDTNNGDKELALKQWSTSYSNEIIWYLIHMYVNL